MSYEETWEKASTEAREKRRVEQAYTNQMLKIILIPIILMFILLALYFLIIYS